MSLGSGALAQTTMSPSPHEDSGFFPPVNVTLIHPGLLASEASRQSSEASRQSSEASDSSNQEVGSGAETYEALEPPIGSNSQGSQQPTLDPLNWWGGMVRASILESADWVRFGMDTVIMDTLQNSPQIQVVTEEVYISQERLIQQDAAFDTSLLFGTDLGRKNDPVGNSLTTGGAPRLVEDSWNGTGGIQKTSRRGGLLELRQQIGLLNSNSTFFEPEHQGNSRLSISLTQPLLGRGHQVYNERLITQARINGNISWEQMRLEVEGRIVQVVQAYWRLYELRCHQLQVQDLLNRGRQLEVIVSARQHFDVGDIEMVKVEQRIARRMDQLMLLDGEIRKQQVRLAILIGSEALSNVASEREMILEQHLVSIPVKFDLRLAVQRGIENRPEVRSATSDLESAALSLRVTRTELQPRLEAVLNAYLSGLNGDRAIVRSLGDQFSKGGPGISAGLQYEMPYRGRAAKARHREAYHRYRIRTEELRQAILQTRGDIEIAIANLRVAKTAQSTKRSLLEKTVREEQILKGRWEALGSDGGAVGQTLESLLDAQQRRTEAERQWVSANANYVIAIVQIQQAMGTLMKQSGISPARVNHGQIEFLPNRDSTTSDFTNSDFNSSGFPSEASTLTDSQPIVEGFLMQPIDDAMIDSQSFE